jgi:hypothetical protein
MAFSAQGIASASGSLGGAVSDIANAIGASSTIAGEEAAAQGFGQAATIAYENSQQEEAAGKLQQVQNARQVYKVGSSGIAAAAGNGLKLEGSAASILRNTSAQGAIASQLIGTQTQIEVNSYISQMQADYAEQQQAEDAANAAKVGKLGALIGGGINAVTGVAQIDMMAAG